MSMKRIFQLIFILNIVIATCFGYAVYSNNCCTSKIDIQALKLAHEKSVAWLVENEKSYNHRHNPALWNLLKKTIVISKHAELKTIFDRYLLLYGREYQTHPLGFLVNGYSRADYNHADLTIYPDYNLLWMYAYSCDSTLAHMQVIKEQLKIDFCTKQHPLSPVCKTHHVMGLNYFSGSRCENQQQIDTMLTALLTDLERQIFFDFRVIDVYLQRVMLLYENNHTNNLNPRWVERIINAQNDDGGWGNFFPLLSVGKNSAIGIGAKSISVSKQHSNFHATTQGAYLTAMVLQHNSAGIEENTKAD